MSLMPLLLVAAGCFGFSLVVFFARELQLRHARVEDSRTRAPRP